MATIVLMFGAVLVILGFLAYYLTGDRYAEKKAFIPHWNLAQGTGRVTSQGFEILQLSPEGVALLIARTHVPARNFSTLEWRIKGLTSKTRLSFLWVTSATSDNEGSLSITESPSEMGRIRLDTSPQWQRTIRGIVLMIQGELPNPLTIERIVLYPPPPQPLELLDQLRSEWSQFEGWRGHSINFIIGGPRYSLFPPVLATAAWVGSSALLYCGLILVTRQRWALKPFILIFLVGWLALDFRWQADLWQQLDITQAQYEGKNWREKRLVASDAELFRFALNIKQHIPESTARVFIITENPAGTNRYMRLRLYYHLLPHNAFTHGWGLGAVRPPYQHNTHPGDYLLIMNPSTDVVYLAKRQVLTWDHGDKTHQLPVEPLLSDPLGTLYRVRSWK